MTTRLGILGAGAVGSVVGGLLTRAGHDVTLVDQWPEHVEAMKQRSKMSCAAAAPRSIS